MTAIESAALRQLASKVLAQHPGSAAGAEALAAAARRAYDDLTRVSAPLIGQVGVETLLGRALHLAQREYPWLAQTRGDIPASIERTPATPPTAYAEEPFAQVLFCLERQNPAVATEAAGAVFAIFMGLLMTFIGESLTTRLLRKAWPEAFSESTTEETQA